MPLVPNERMDAVPSGEPRYGIFPMLSDAPGQVRGDADGERPVASAGRDGNEGAFQVILWIPAFAGMTKGEQE